MVEQLLPSKTSICFSSTQIHYQAFSYISLFVPSCYFSSQVYFECQVLLSYLFAMSLLYVYLYQAFWCFLYCTRRANKNAMEVVTLCLVACNTQRCEGVLSSQDIVAKESTKKETKVTWSRFRRKQASTVAYILVLGNNGSCMILN